MRKKDEIVANRVELAAFGQARSVGASLSTTIGEGSGRGSTAHLLGGRGSHPILVDQDHNLLSSQL